MKEKQAVYIYLLSSECFQVRGGGSYKQVCLIVLKQSQVTSIVDVYLKYPQIECKIHVMCVFFLLLSQCLSNIWWTCLMLNQQMHYKNQYFCLCENMTSEMIVTLNPSFQAKRSQWELSLKLTFSNHSPHSSANRRNYVIRWLFFQHLWRVLLFYD